MCAYRLRAVTAEDAKTLFDWTNDPVTRQNSFQSKPVLWEEHIAWLQRKLEDENCFFFILTERTDQFITIVFGIYYFRQITYTLAEDNLKTNDGWIRK